MLAGLCPCCLLGAGLHHEYTIVNILGRGENGTTYLAEQHPAHRLVTLKLLHAVSEDNAVLERLQRQRRALAAWAHPQATRYIDIGVTGDRRPYVIREYLRGAPITAHCEQSQSDRTARQRLLANVVDVIAQAHRAGITHGGLTASNVFIISRGGEPLVRVMDFGVRPASPADDIAALERLTAALS
jgi:eukaryotic-like serine/threonine-protein kinase